METKFTKGKWNLLSNVSWCEIQTELPIKSICAINKNIEEYEANALLISKAPEMLEMLIKYNSIIKAKELENLIKEATEI